MSAKSVAVSRPVAEYGFVLWKPYPNAAPEECSPAIVTRTGNICSVAIVPKNGGPLYPRDSVRHESDPDNRLYSHLNNGVWAYIASEKA